MTRTRNRISAIALVSLVGAAGLVGCSPTEQSDEDNVVAACAALAKLDAVLSDASTGLAEADTAGDLRAIREEVSEVYTEAAAAVDAVANDRGESLKDAWTAFADGVSAVDEDTVLEDARASLVEEARAVSEARQLASSDLACD